MKRLTIRQAIRYAVSCNENIDEYEPPVINRKCLKMALSYMCRMSNNAREIVGAAKLVEIVCAMEKGYRSSALQGEIKLSIAPYYESLIGNIVRKKVGRIIYLEKDVNGNLIEVTY